MRRLDANGNQKLTSPRVFTQAQWPPATPYVGEVVLLADTYSGLTFAWMLEYRPDLDSSYPWRIYNGKTASWSTAYAISHVQSSTNVWEAFGSIQVPIAGSWNIVYLAYSDDHYTLTNSQFGLSAVSSTGHELLAQNESYSSMPSAISTAYTATKGQTIYTSIFGNASQQYYGSLMLQPVKVAAA